MADKPWPDACPVRNSLILTLRLNEQIASGNGNTPHAEKIRGQLEDWRHDLDERDQNSLRKLLQAVKQPDP